MRTLALDIGNTAVKAGAFDGPLLREMQAGLTAAQVRALVQRWQPQHVVVASVASVAEAAVLVVEDLRELVPGEILAFSPATTSVPLRNAYATPHSLGADRLAGAVGAAKLRPGRDTLIIDAGTALKFDLVTADGTYHGGSIAPGLAMRLRALHAFTGRLPLLELPAADATIGLMGDSTTGQPAERRGERYGGRNQRLTSSVSAAAPGFGRAADRGRRRLSGGPAPGAYLCRSRAGTARAKSDFSVSC